jgi:CheY-like chemotaxis protein
LGLSISKELLKLMEGEMDVISEKGKGSQFTFTAKFDKVSPTELKEYKQKERSSTPNGQGSPSDTQRKVATQRRFTHLLAAEDNGLNRKILAKYLHRCDKLMLVNDGQQAYDYYQKHAHEIDLIIMDQEMPQVDGKEATKMIRAFEKRFEAEQKRKDDSDGAFAEGPGQRRKHKDWKYRVPIIALSGNVRSEQIAEAKNVSSPHNPI